MEVSFVADPLYIQMRSSWIQVTNVKTGDSAEANVSLSVGKNGQSHPRALVTDLTGASEAIGSLIGKIYKGSWSFIKPVVIVHPLEKTEGGLTHFEKRLLTQVTQSFGRSIYIFDDEDPVPRGAIAERLKGMKPEQSSNDDGPSFYPVVIFRHRY